MTELIRYEAARRALTEAVAFDEVMSIMNVAKQAELYAKQANDSELIEKATEIRVRAQRKAGEMLRIAAERGERCAAGDGLAAGRPSGQAVSMAPTLKDIGVHPKQSSRWQSLASMSEEHFETAVATAKDTAGQVTTAFMLREAEKHRRPQGKPMKGPKADAIKEELKAAKQRGVSMLCSYGRLLMQAITSQEEFSEEERELLVELEAVISKKVSASK